MHNDTSRRRAPAPLPKPHSSAFTWIDRRHAVVARTMPSGAIDVREIDLPDDAARTEPALTHIADIIGDRERVFISGSNGLRTELERRYVSIYRRPDRIVDVEPAEAMSRHQIIARLRELAR